jgi:hypothetical protein
MFQLSAFSDIPIYPSEIYDPTIPAASSVE